MRNKVVLIVNTASKCSLSPQYQDLEDLYRRLRETCRDGFMILGIPYSQFSRQEPWSAGQIQLWLKKQKAVSWCLRKIKWIFTKFVMYRNGQVRSQRSPTTKPESLEKHLTSLLEE
ncbi:uncharacterized protein ATNIH1004_007164 [Aspergillus tanneri]|uniref:Glutathione peroxidase n=1 Tax=Aspergillus tanneri TaxID=1220188 RepID=A0A5M9MFJ2_9EURO|nr:uncharacterized protein ATNIH1004_007164 [Aspergillus tanneri]KAA8645745.1 hypothetical protein ATNIH1004_007164 [Aspergillus tanneri]